MSQNHILFNFCRIADFTVIVYFFGSYFFSFELNFMCYIFYKQYVTNRTKITNHYHNCSNSKVFAIKKKTLLKFLCNLA